MIHHYTIHTCITPLFQAEASRVHAELWETEVAIRRLECRLWERGVRFRDRPVGADYLNFEYQDALDADPQLAALCDGAIRLAERYREKRWLELEMLELLKQVTNSGCGTTEMDE